MQTIGIQHEVKVEFIVASRSGRIVTSFEERDRKQFEDFVAAGAAKGVTYRTFKRTTSTEQITLG